MTNPQSTFSAVLVALAVALESDELQINIDSTNEVIGRKVFVTQAEVDAAAAEKNEETT